MIKAVIFDWGGVLIENPRQSIIDYAARRLSAEAETLDRLFRQHMIPFQTGSISEASFWTTICDALRVKPPKVQSLWYEAFAHSYREKEATFHTIAHLRTKGYKIGFLSNTEEPARVFFYEKNYRCFDAEIFSCIVNIAKPDKRIYVAVAEQLTVRPEECLFVDDSEENIDGACSTGMRGILYQTHEQFIGALWDTL